MVRSKYLQLFGSGFLGNGLPGKDRASCAESQKGAIKHRQTTSCQLWNPYFIGITCCKVRTFSNFR